MRILLALAILGIFIFSASAYGQTSNDLTYKMVPSKIMENTEGVLHVYGSGGSSTAVQNLIVTSSDSRVIKILKIEPSSDGFTTDVKIQAVSGGVANIALAAPGFSSQEFEVTVYRNNDNPTTLLIKTTPSVFTTTGPTHGYVTVELANDEGFPTRAYDDTTVTLSSSDNNVVTLQDSQIVIKKGDYFSTGSLEVKKDGTAQITASSSSMQAVNGQITVNPSTSTPLMIQSYVFPKIVSSTAASYAYAIVQLQDSSGNPVQASEDIPIKVQISNSSGTKIVNTSDPNQQISANSPLIIKKGSYWGEIPLIVYAGLNNTWNVDISAKGYQVSGPATLTTESLGIIDDRTANVDTLPILATGQHELIGVLHLQDANGNPVLASKDLDIKIYSSDTNSLSVDDVNIARGTSVALVYGSVGTSVSPNAVSLNVVTNPPQTSNPTFFPLVDNTLQLVAEPLVPKILSYDNFPLSLYMTKDDALTYSTEDVTPLVSPKEFIQTESKAFPKGQSVMILNSNLLKESARTVSVSAGSYVGSVSLEGFSSKPAALLLDQPAKLLSNVKNTFSVELIDEQQNPVIADHDTELKIVSNNPSMLDAPDNVVIKKGSYYSLFDLQPKSSGPSQISILTSDIPLSKFDIDITSLVPEVTISSIDFINQNTVLDASVTAQFDSQPLKGMKVDWKVVGGTVRNMESVTNENGRAVISIISGTQGSVVIDAIISGGAYETASAEKSVTINEPLITSNTSEPSSNPIASMFNISGINTLFVILPVAAAVGGIVLKKKNMLDGIMEKMNFGERFSSIKEKISEIKEK